jgi:hypothetical protein
MELVWMSGDGSGQDLTTVGDNSVSSAELEAGRAYLCWASAACRIFSSATNTPVATATDQPSIPADFPVVVRISEGRLFLHVARLTAGGGDATLHVSGTVNR